MLNGVLYDLPLHAGDRAVWGSYAASRNIQGRQHSCREDRGDQFAVGHFRSPLLDEGVNADCIAAYQAVTRVKIVAELGRGRRVPIVGNEAINGAAFLACLKD